MTCELKLAECAVNRWSGHLPYTCNVLLALLLRRLEGGTVFSPDERALFIVSEFWAANESDGLAAYLDSDLIARLGAARAAFTEIRAFDVARTLCAAIESLNASESPTFNGVRSPKMLCGKIVTDDAVDLLIARFARRCVQSELIRRSATDVAGHGIRTVRSRVH